ncbi:MAG TPA: amidohydrolase family protein [Dehalococcoidia bacterium]|nr:amidohydrolase family protein [Dehalococcoidia bacterium]
MKIFDVHMHFPRNWENPAEDPAPTVERLVDFATAAGITKACMLTGGRFGVSYERGMEIIKQYGDYFVPVAMIDPEEIDGAAVRQLHGLGFRGLKLIGTARPYDEPDYMGAYAAAQDLGMPILFHMGVIGGGLDYSRTHPRRDPEAAASYKRMQEMMSRVPLRDVSAGRMSPLHLDTIANRFPQLRIIGAHLGNQGNYEFAASVARWRHNVWFDMSGGETIERHAIERDLIGKEIGIEKLTWGSDCSMEQIRNHIGRFEQMFEELKLSGDEVDRLWWRNAAEIYGLEEPTFAEE